jgi:hypothetical protein
MKPGMDFIYAIGAFSVVVGYMKTNLPRKYILHIITILLNSLENISIMSYTV